ncbi:hypothetical protein FN846DRAFT_942728 [Sphaerosporella brunnea]|uniref:Uncharacterized protein n=1 Tax=Sphaerosporella brunnea TaxID=1250544 RepID=A0A5J5F1F6_9PEZI|nr:hypothetical protein FN846DRAFT_942728 [Sphaerosporella brunnea]
MKLDCVVNRSLQTILDEDIEWKSQMRDDTVQLQHAVEDILTSLNMRPFASYFPTSPPFSRPSSEPPNSKGQPLPQREGATCHPNVQFQDAPATHMKLEDDRARQARAGLSVAREPTSQSEEQNGQPMFPDPMGSLYGVTRMRGAPRGGARGGTYPEEMDTDFIARGPVPQEGGDMMADQQQHPAQSPGSNPHHGGPPGIAAYAVGHGHPQQQQQQHWQAYHLQQQAPPGDANHAQMLYSQSAATATPVQSPGMHNGHPGGQVYDVNGSYFGMTAFDPQLPYYK